MPDAESSVTLTLHPSVATDPLLLVPLPLAPVVCLSDSACCSYGIEKFPSYLILKCKNGKNTRPILPD
jgi:hypothetical protein